MVANVAFNEGLPARKPKLPMPLTRRTIISLALLVFCAVLLAAPYAMPLSRVQQLAAVKVSALFGQDVSFTNATRQFGFPLPTYALQNVQISGSANGPVLLQAPRIEAELSLLSLLTGTIDISSLSIVTPKIALSNDRLGRSNWRSAASMLALFDPQQIAAQVKPPVFLQIGDIRLINGSVLYSDAVTGTRTQMSDVNVLLHWPDLTQRFAVRGQLVMNGSPVKFNASLSKPAALFQKSISPFDLNLDIAGLTAALSGEVFADDSLQADADLRLASPSLHALTALIMPQLQDVPEIGTIGAKARLKIKQHTTILENATFDVGASHGEGTLALQRETARPALQGTLDFDVIDLRPFFKNNLEIFSAAQNFGNKSAPEGGTAPLTALDLDIRVSTAKLLASTTVIEKAALSVITKPTRVELSLGDGEAYGGKIAARLVAEQMADTLKTSAALNFDNIRADDALREMFGAVRLTGISSLSLSLMGEGKTSSAILSSLSGDATFKLKDGSLAGADLSALMAHSNNSFVDALLAARNGASTITQAAAHFTIANGAAHTDDATMTGPGYAVQLMGDVKLASPGFDMTGIVTPATGTADAAASTATDTSAKRFPFVIKGPLMSPLIAPASAGL